MSEITVAALGAVGVTGVTIFAAWVRWSLTTAVRIAVEKTVNGKIDRLSEDVARAATDSRAVREWSEDHDSVHRALTDALNRQGIARPDGLGGPT